MLPELVMEGRLTADPNLRFLESGIGVCDFTIAANDRKRSDSGEWEDTGDPLFVRVTAWRRLAENCSESLNKGDLVIVRGKLQNRKYEDKEGNARTSLEVTANSVAVSLAFRVVKHSGERARGSRTDDDQWTPPADEEPPF